MNPHGIDRAVFDALRHRPSRAAVAAIGQRFVLNGAPPALATLGLEVVSEMICDWSVPILEEAVNDPKRVIAVRRVAVDKLGELMLKAVRRGYSGISERRCRSLVEQAQAELRVQEREGGFGRIPSVEELCDHLSRAVAGGVFGMLPDF